MELYIVSIRPVPITHQPAGFIIMVYSPRRVWLTGVLRTSARCSIRFKIRPSRSAHGHTHASSQPRTPPSPLSAAIAPASICSARAFETPGRSARSETVIASMRRVHRRKSCRCIHASHAGPLNTAPHHKYALTNGTSSTYPPSYPAHHNATGSPPLGQSAHAHTYADASPASASAAAHQKLTRQTARPNGTLIAASGKAFVPVENSNEPPPISKSRMRPAPQPCQRRTAKYVIAAS